MQMRILVIASWYAMRGPALVNRAFLLKVSNLENEFACLLVGGWVPKLDL